MFFTIYTKITLMNVLVVGSCLIDLFSELSSASDAKVVDTSVSFKLGSKVPINIKSLSLGGNGGNVSSAIKKLSIDAHLYTYLGNDPLSRYIEEVMEKEGVDVIVEKTDTTTGSLSFIMDFPSDRIIFSHHNKYPHGFNSDRIVQQPDIIYLTSIGKEWEDAYKKVLAYASQYNIPVAFSPGSQQLQDMNEVFIQTIHQAKMLFCNMEEARLINQKLTGEKIDDIKQLLLNLKNNGFDLLSITDGANGAYAADKDGKVYHIPSLPPEGSEKTGAGDAYAAAFLVGFLNKLSTEECMKKGVLNALGVMSHIGAHTGQLRNEEIEEKANQTELSAQII